MPATAKLYETDPYVQTFTATVLVCTPAGEQFAVQLDRTAFYPEGGGQPCDTGALGTALVTDVQEHGGVITHTVTGFATGFGCFSISTLYCQRSAAGWADGGRPH